MATGLSAQLQRLRAPQTKTLLDLRHRKSILFNAKEAAKTDRRTIYEIGVSGLQELIILNPCFQQFEETLFEENTLNMERAVEKSDVNELLDKNINKFLLCLSPYFLLRPAQMCIEWLLRRFYIHEYNSTALIALILPYHDTKVFVRTLQTIHVQETMGNSVNWSWLRPLQKAGVRVPITLIANHAASMPSFLRLICNHTADVVKEFGTNGHLAQAHINFFVAVVVGALENASVVQENHILAVLPSLLQALNSKIEDFVSAAYMIIAQLVSHTQLTSKLCNVFVRRIATVSMPSLYTTAITLLVTILDKQEAANTKSLKNEHWSLVQNNWLTEILSKLCNENVDVSPICIYLMQSSILEIQNNHPQSQDLKRFLERFISEITFPSVVAQRLISCFLDLYVGPQKKGNKINDDEVIDLEDSDDETNTNFQTWYSDYLNKLQRQYPDAFDQTVKDTLQIPAAGSKSNRRLALNIALGLRLKYADENLINLYESIYHHTANIRLLAVETLIENVSDYRTRPKCYELLKNCLADRLYDEDNENVIAAVLKLPTKDFIDILGPDKYLNALFEILYKRQLNEKQWKPLIALIIEHITSEILVEQCNTNLLLLALMPLLFPNGSDDDAVHNITKILKSPLVKHVEFLKSLDIEKAKINDNFSISEFKRHFLSVLAVSAGTPTVDELLQCIEGHEKIVFKMGIHFSYFLIILIVCIRHELTSAKTLQIFEYFRKCSESFKISDIKNKDKLLVEMIAPLQLIEDFLVKLTKFTKFDLICWTEIESTDLNCFMRIFDWLVGHAMAKKQIEEKVEWIKLVQVIFNTVFETEIAKINFLLNFYLHNNFKTLPHFEVLRLIAFKLFDAVMIKPLEDTKLGTVHILKICVALSSSSETLRVKALHSLKLAQNLVSESWKDFISSILDRSYEISIDEEQFSLVLYTILKTTQKKQIYTAKILKDILQLLTTQETIDGTFTAEVLHMLKHINAVDILNQLMPIAEKVLDKTINEDGIIMLPAPYNRIYGMILERLDYQTIEPALLHNANAWQLIDKSLKRYDVFLTVNEKLQPLSCLLLNAFDDQLYEKMPKKYKILLIKQIIKTIALAENDTVLLAANKLLKKCTIDCEPFAEILEGMFNETAANSFEKTKTTSKRTAIIPQYNVQSMAWREGVSFLELLENKKQLQNAHKLIPTLFELLRFCITIEEQARIEYAKQLTLSSLHHIIRTSEAENINLHTALPPTVFRVDQIVQCLRSTQNPQTQNNSLLLLSTCARIFPQQVLHNIVDMFTFMGSSVVRQEDAFSFHIITNIIESIIPILVETKQHDAKIETLDQQQVLVISVLKVFSDIILDVPEHRRLSLYTKLLHTLGAEQFLWIFLCIVFEAHVLEDDKQKLLQKKIKTTNPLNTQEMGEKFTKRLQIVLELANCFEPQVILGTCIQLMHYIKSLPASKEQKMDVDVSSAKQYTNAGNTEITLFDVTCRTSKQLRHYKYVIMQFLSTVTSSTAFLERIATLGDDQLLEMKPYYQNFIIKILSYVPVVSTAIERIEEQSQNKFWKVILHHVHDVLENAISLLSPDMFLVVIVGLLQHKVLSIRRKVIELLINKLQRKDEYFDRCDQTNFQKLLQPLIDIVDSIAVRDESITIVQLGGLSNEIVLLQQNALIAIKLLSKKFALKYMDEFKELLGKLTKITKKRGNISKIVLATVFLTLVDIACNLRAHSLAYLPKYMPQLIDVLQDQGQMLQNQPPDNICLSIVAGIHKVVETLPLFLAPYIVDIILVIGMLMERISKCENKQDQRCINALQKMSGIWTKLANEVPLRVLVPCAATAYEYLIEAKRYRELTSLMNLIHETLRCASTSDLNAMQKDITNFFMQALKFRQYVNDKNDIDAAELNAIESNMITAFAAWVLKLSESSFRPLYQNVHQWAFNETKPDILITFFRLTTKLSDALKSLFVVFSSNLIDAIASLLKTNNFNTLPMDSDAETHSDLLAAILNTLFNIFLYDNKKFINVQRFEMLMQPLVDQLENTLVLTNETLKQTTIACIAQLAVAVSSDILWKQLNYQVLLKTRTNVPEVRMLAFESCIEIARKLGEDFTTLLPETVPFVAELFEDENPRVEKCTRKLVQELEGILGESIQKYL